MSSPTHRIPVASAPTAEPAATILVVEDEEALADSVRYNLEREGYTVIVAADGRRALERFREEPPALVILDLMLPEMSGLDVCRMIRADSDLPIIIVTAKDSGRLHKPGILRLALVSVNGIPVSTNSRSFQGKSHTKSNAVKIGGGTAAGALIGGLAGGGKGALIGAGAGAAAGTGVAYATGKEQAVVPAETTLTFTTR